MRNISKKQGLVIGVIIIFALVFFLIINNKAEVKQEVDIQPEKIELENSLERDVASILETMAAIHYISLDEGNSTNPDTFIMDELTEAMNDINKLERVVQKSEIIRESDNQIISTSGLVLNVTALNLIEAYNNWVTYVRTVNIESVDVNEFQYQYALFGTETHDAYLKLSEGLVLLPMVTVEFGENGEENTINQELVNVFLENIDLLFSDILIENDLYYEETGLRNVIPVIIDTYLEFFGSN